MSFVYVADGIDDVLAAHLNQYADAWSGVAGKGQPFNAVAVNDPINFAISARNLDPTNSRAAQFMKADGTVLFQCDASGVKVSPDGTVAGVPVTVNSVQTFSALKTFTAGLQVQSGNVGIGAAPASTVGIYMPSNAAVLGGGASQWGALIQALGSSAGTAEITGVQSQPATPATVFTVTTVADFHAANPIKGATSIITSAYGLLVDAINAGNTNNYGAKISAPSGGTIDNVAISAYGDVILGGGGFGAALATTDTGGYLFIPQMAGAPTGVPSINADHANHAAIVYDVTNSKLWVRAPGVAWKGVVVA